VNNLAVTYQHIADILSYDSDTSKLESILSQAEFNWDAIVKEGSKHLVLPAIFCRLKSKQLLHVLPTDLLSYLKYITELNRNRNSSILNQMQSISNLLNQNHINHVFLKGAALLVSNIYEDPAERMIGDIDILIDLSQIDEAFELFIKNGYSAEKEKLGHSFFGHKHLPRLTMTNQIAAVELHKKLFNSYNYKNLENKNIISKSQKSNGFSIPSPDHLLEHNILNFQINDNGRLFNSLNFRSAYDTMTINNFYSFNNSKILNRTIFYNYLNIVSIFFNDLNKFDISRASNIKSFYIFKLNNLQFYKIWNTSIKFIKYLPLLVKRFLFFLKNKEYRNQLFSERKRILNHFFSNNYNY